MSRVERYEMEGYEITFFENGHSQSDGFGVHAVPSPEGEWVDHKDYESLLNNFKNYHDLVLQLLEHVMDGKPIPVGLFNKCSTAHNETCHIREILSDN